MAFPKKGLRKIKVNEQVYVWSAKGSDMVISLHIMALIDGGQVLAVNFPYMQDETKHPSGGVSLSNQFVITPYIVRQVILQALEEGWNPLERGPEIRIEGIDDKIDLRLDMNKEQRIKDKTRHDNPYQPPNLDDCQ